MSYNSTVALVSPFIDRWRAARSDGEEVQSGEHIHWNVAFSPSAVETDRGNIWPVLGTLHAAGPGGWGDVSVAGYLRNADDVPAESFADVLADSEAIETLYDFARSHFLPLLAGVGAEIDIPKKSPEAKMSPYEFVVEEVEAEKEQGSQAPA